MGKVKGIVLFDLQMDASMSGVYTSNDPSMWGTTLPHSARLINGIPTEDGVWQIIEYDCFYFDFPTGGVECKLLLYSSSTVYKAKWVLNGKTILQGKGFKMNDRQIAISYKVV